MLGKFIRHWIGMKSIYEVKDKHDVKGIRRAIRIREKIGLLYAFIAWNTFGFALYIFLKDKIPDDPVEKKKSVFGLTGAPGNMHVLQVRGFTVKKEYDMKNEFEKDLNEEIKQ